MCQTSLALHFFFFFFFVVAPNMTCCTVHSRKPGKERKKEKKKKTGDLKQSKRSRTTSAYRRSTRMARKSILAIIVQPIRMNVGWFVDRATILSGVVDFWNNYCMAFSIVSLHNLLCLLYITLCTGCGVTVTIRGSP